ncbi:NAD(P)-dependent dehydrogenase (short-subunit alcohol dehydrogenase family) [Stackebrandtia albiflava]|uniref:NAD(P)-dependent dehydrogenase (Short-subunit alcohol dehydrogenase family) n=1 Tax=Stackebrandtia albiflava TaxID=406432 RepID=A0A562URK6_9ACTN|nr:SDR family oxidoreductase [Stackebrandtia albiflava]TWJ08241.1 NAD(P)-dependent dehydrogenase (short-subunit alcohol dehydrogenase family) [Stackebrandtia albiflava]
MQGPLSGKVALVAGATRGAGRAFAVELSRAGAFVYATGRSSAAGRSEIDRPETIEGTVEAMEAAGGRGAYAVVDHLEPERVRELVARIESEQGRLDVLVNNIWGGDHLWEGEAKLWEHDLDAGLRILRLGVESHIVTSHAALPLLVRRPGGLVVEVTDGTWEYNSTHYRKPFFYDLAKAAPHRMTKALAEELADSGGTAVCVTPGWIRSEAMLDTHFEVTEENWRDGANRDPHFLISETPYFVARGTAALAADPDVARWNGQTLSSHRLSQEYGTTDVDGSRPDAWSYISEVVEGGADRTADDYR